MSSLSDVKAYVQLARPQNASGSVFTYGFGYFLVSHSLKLDFLTGLVVLLALHSLATLQNDIADFEIDRANRRQGALQNQNLSITQATAFVYALGCLAVVFAALSPHRRLHFIAIIGLVIIAWLYNLNPVRASKRPLMSITVMGICYGVLPFIYGYFLADGKLSYWAFLALAPLLFFARFSTAVLKDYKDAAGDKLFKKITFYLRYGARLTAWTSIILSIIAYAGLVLVMIAARHHTAWFDLALTLAVLLAARSILLRLRLTETKSEEKLNGLFHRIVFSHNQFEGALLLCLLVSLK